MPALPFCDPLFLSLTPESAFPILHRSVFQPWKKTPNLTLPDIVCIFRIITGMNNSSFNYTGTMNYNIQHIWVRNKLIFFLNLKKMDKRNPFSKPNEFCIEIILE